MASKKKIVVPASPVKREPESYAVLPMSEVFADSTWNARSGDWVTASGGPDDSLGFQGFMASIEIEGQNTPVDVRPNPKAGPGKAKYLLDTGFRRFEALRQIAERNGDKNPTVKAIIRNRSEQEARKLNLQENALRDDLKPSDLCYGVRDLSAQGMTQEQIGAVIGKNQTYAGKLLRIATNFCPKVFKHWRDAESPVPVQDLEKLATRAKAENMPASVQWDEYSALFASEEGEGDAKKPHWTKKAKEQVRKSATMIGALHRAELLDCEDFDFVEAVGQGHLCKMKDDATENQINAIAKIAETAFKAATKIVEPEPEAETDEDEE